MTYHIKDDTHSKIEMLRERDGERREAQKLKGYHKKLMYAHTATRSSKQNKKYILEREMERRSTKT